MGDRIRGAVVVVTGASSGIGEATAFALAARGASVVLAARREESLEEVARQCVARGGQAKVVPTDVTDDDAVQALGARAMAEFGRLDAWVNNAGVYCIGSLEDTPDEVFRRVMEVNFFAYVSGARAASAAFRQSGCGGVLVNVSSLYGKLSGPYVSAYSASKFAVRGFSEALRQEVRGTGMKVCTVFPLSVDTPVFEHAANFSGYAIRPMEPILRPERVARAIVRCLERPRREVRVGAGAWVFDGLHTLSPGLYEALMSWAGERRNFERRAAAPTSGVLYAPSPTGTGVSGGYRPAWTQHLGSRWLIAAGLVPAVVGVAELARRRMRRA